MSTLNEKGQEVFDQTPVDYPIHFDRPVPLHVRMRQQIIALQEEMRMQNEYETPEEADDFDVEDDDQDWDSPYEVDFDHINEKTAFKNESAVNAAETLVSGDGTAQPPKAENQPSETEKS